MVFTWGEEAGHAGAKALEVAGLRARRGFVLDALLPTGSIITAAPGPGRAIVCQESVLGKPNST